MSAQSSLGVQEEERISSMALDMDTFTILTTDELAELQPGGFLRAVTAEPSPVSQRC